MSESRAVAVATPNQSISVFSSEPAFESAQRMAKALVSSNLVPANYKGGENMGNALIAMDMAGRMGLSPMVVMQNLHVIEGRPSWASSFIISALNSCGLFSPLRWRITDLGEREIAYTKWEGPKGSRQQVTHKMKVRDKEWVAYAVEKATGEVLEGPPVSIGMAVAEGWYTKPGSKWLTMEDLMGRYRSAAFFGRLYAPHILNGLQTQDEIIDVEYEVVNPAPDAPFVNADDKPSGRARGLHAALANNPAAEQREEAGEQGQTEASATKPATKSGAKNKAKPVQTEAAAAHDAVGFDDRRAEPEPEPNTEPEDDAVDADAMVADDDGEDIYGPDDGDDEFQPA